MTYLQRDLLAMPPGTRVSPREACSDVENYIHRADQTHALRQRLDRLSERGVFRRVAADEWQRT